MGELFLGADWMIPLWFFAPWLIFIQKLFQVSAYEWRIKLYAGLQPFNFPGLVRRIRQQRDADPDYNRMRKSTHRWFVICVCWWSVSVVGLLGLIFLAAH